MGVVGVQNTGHQSPPSVQSVISSHICEKASDLTAPFFECTSSSISTVTREHSSLLATAWSFSRRGFETFEQATKHQTDNVKGTGTEQTACTQDRSQGG